MTEAERRAAISGFHNGLLGSRENPYRGHLAYIWQDAYNEGSRIGTKVYPPDPPERAQ